MKYQLYLHLNKFIFWIVIYLIIIHQIISYLNFTYPQSILLSNQNIFIIHKLGISICDPSYSRIINNLTNFEENEMTEQILSKVALVSDNGYIFCIINEYIYIFDENENSLFKDDNKIINYDDLKYYTLVPINITNDYYYYLIGFVSYSLLNFLYYGYNISSKENKLIIHQNFKYYFHDKTYYIETYSLSCQYVNHQQKGKALLCFFIINEAMQNYLVTAFYNVENGVISNSSNFENKYYLFERCLYIKSDINKEHSRMVVGFRYEMKNGGGFFLYDIYQEYNNINYFLENDVDFCRNKSYGMKVNYFEDKNEYIFGCLNNKNASIIIEFIKNEEFDENYNYEKNEIIKFTECESIYGFSFIYEKKYKNYYILSDEICGGNNYPVLYLSNNYIIEEEEEEKEEEEKEEEEKEEEEKEEEEKEEKEKEEEEDKKEEVEDKEAEDKEEEEEENQDIVCLQKCLSCNKESLSKGLCLECNNNKGYYELNNRLSISKQLQIYGEFKDCANETTKPPNFYFDKDNDDYKPCYETCGTCDYGGDSIENNCTSCEDNYINEPEFSNSTNCVIKCSYYYYFTTYGKYKCTSFQQCPKNYNYFIAEKKKCIDNCKNDNIYKYLYNGECIKECPNSTESFTNDYICKDRNQNKCQVSENNFTFFEEQISEREIDIFAKNYAKEFNYTDNHISILKNNIYSIIIYKNSECILELSLEFPKIEFGECEKKIKNINGIKQNLIIVIIIKKRDKLNYKTIDSYYFFDPISGQELPINDICQDESLITQENLMVKLNKDKTDLDSLFFLTNQDINVFNISSEFYTDICYNFESPIDKDIALKDRILLYYPNITLCENNCKIKGINLTTFRAECECKFNNLINNAFIKDNVFIQNQIGEIEQFISQTNINIIKCYNNISFKKNMSNYIGCYIIICLIIIQIIMTVIYCNRSLYLIIKYILEITSKYIKYLKNRESKNSENSLVSNDKKSINNNGPPKKRFRGKIENQEINIGNACNTDKIKKILSINSSENNLIGSKNSFFQLKHHKKKKKFCKDLPNKKIFISNQTISFHDINKIQNESNIDIEEYLRIEYDDMDFDDAIKEDKRKFFEYFMHILKINQMILNTFFNNDFLRPRAIKIILFILDIDLYLIINALFFNEDYISEIFHLTKEEKFFSFISRSINKFFYITLVGVILNYIIDCFFFEENKIKGIFRREKDNIIVLRYQISKTVKLIKQRNLLFIILSFFITSFSLYYIFCFHNIYPNMRNEWIKSSIVAIIIMQIFYLLKCLFKTIIRFLGLKCDSERIYKISLLF